MPPASDDSLAGSLRAARPADEQAIARRVGLARVLDRVLGRRPSAATVGAFALEEKVGEGGMGVVYRGRAIATGERVAIKLLERQDARARDRFAQEAQVLRAIAHPRIVRYLDHGTTDEGFDFLVMEWLDGVDLATSLRQGPWSPEDVVRLGLEAATGLDAAHAAGVLHRDVKPSNLFLPGRDVGSLRVIDFGVAHAERLGPRLTSTGAVVGTPHYMAPEQIRGIDSVRTDVYGLGATLYECLVGRPPYGGEHAGAVLLSVMADPVPSARALRPEVPRALDALLGRMMAKDPRDRPEDARAVVLELGALVGEVAGRESTPLLSLRESDRPDAPEPDAAIAPAPELVGRGRELGALAGMLEDAHALGEAAAVLVVGDEGVGRTSLVREFARRAATRPRTQVVELALGPDDAGVTFGALRAFLKRLHGLARADDDRTREAIDDAIACLRVLASDAAPLELDRIRALSDGLRGAFYALVHALDAQTSWVLTVDDVARCDLASLRYFTRLVDPRTPGARLLVLTARPTDAVELAMPQSPAATLHRLEIGPLSRSGASQLALRLAPDLDHDAVCGLVARSEGHPDRLVSLLAATPGVTPPPQARGAELKRAVFVALPAESRRILRAIALDPSGLPLAVVAELVGVGADSPQLAEQLRFLEASRLLRRARAHDGSVSLVVDDARLRSIALESIDTAERLRAHLAIGRRLADDPSTPPSTVMMHARLGGSPGAAGSAFLRAAREALAGEDAALLDRIVDEGRSCVDDPSLRGRLETVRAEALFWRGDLRAARASAELALADLRPGSVAHFEALGLAITSAGQMGDRDAVRAGAGAATAARRDDDATDAFVVCVCRALTQLRATSDPSADAIEATVEAACATQVPSAIAAGWRARVAAWSRVGEELDGSLGRFHAAHGALMRAGDVRGAGLIHAQLGSFYVWTGAFERAREVIDDALDVARRLDSPQLSRIADYTLAKLEAETAPFGEVRPRLRALAQELAASPRMLAGAHVYLGLAALRTGHDAAARAAARDAADAHDEAVIRLAARAIGRIARSTDEPSAEAGAALDAMLRDREAHPTLPEFDTLVSLGVVHAFDAVGDRAEADARLGATVDALLARAATLADPLARSLFLSRPYANARLVDLARTRLGRAIV